MKKNILFLILISIIFSCATKKPEQRSKFLKGFSSQYNTLFNAEQALQAEFDARTSAHKDNFYAPYISVLTYDELPKSTISENNFGAAGFNNNNNNPPPIPQKGGRPSVQNDGQLDSNVKGSSILEIAEAKALKTIEKYSVTREGQEKNDNIFDAYIALAQARIYMGKPLSAIDALSQVSLKMKNDKRLPLAKIYEGLAYSKMKDNFKANEIFAKLKTEKLKKSDENLLAIFYSESLLISGNKEAALKELNNGFDLQNDRKLKSRIAFLRGQILASQNKNEIARESFLDAYKYANDFEFEVKSQIEIAKTYNSKNDYSGAKEYLENISKKGTYGSRKNEFYYAIGLMANRASKKEEAMQYFRKSLKEKVSDPQIRGLDYFEIGKSFLNDNDYIAAGAYYDSALVVMTYEPTKIELKEQSGYIKKIAKNYYLVKKNDSILSLAKMSPEERETYFSKYIASIKAKDEIKERQRLQEERNKGFGDSDTNANSIFAGNSKSFDDFGNAGKGFYFANNNTVSKGSSEFKKVWGDRALADNWRLSARSATIADEKNKALGLSSLPDPRRYESSFYIEKIPNNPTILDGLKKSRDTASLGLGTMYQDFFTNTPLSTKTLYDLVDNKPEEKVMLQALYQIFNINYKENPQIAERAKQILITDYPYTSYAEFARNPQNSTFVKSDPEAEKAYKSAFFLYEQEKFAESSKVIDLALKQYPKDALVPKFSLLNAFNAGKTAGKEVMILQLEQIALNFEKTSEGEKAKEMLNYLKSNLTIQMKDNNGNAINPNSPPADPNALPENSGKINQQKIREGLDNQKKEVQPQMNINPQANEFTPPPIPSAVKKK
ncbi:type IX secretion system periplasmic lipoprotein PorW/SprE [Frigoriflavimonas asaccharolytica]|uniref:Tetratricopeptide repeat protein n=1 Tax=Frigoriflavimonas asaccharolytica TaxID=2735899 RepID=A0A8J8G4L6_9FLAO|nr:tetratricopeptide repeat protein [Frigoriflavimonas asaccharolytica]NRS91196.1 hypothetical protein [Frigoriflavimonas asaccharolytica]